MEGDLEGEADLDGLVGGIVTGKQEGDRRHQEGDRRHPRRGQETLTPGPIGSPPLPSPS